MNLKPEILKKYDLGRALDFGEVTGGFLTKNKYLLTNTGKFFIKVHRRDNHKNIDLIEFSENFFHQFGVPVILPIKNHFLESHETVDENLITIYPFLEYKSYKNGELSLNHFYVMGKLLGKMHSISVENKKLYKTYKKEVKTRKRKEVLKELQEISNKISQIANPTKLDEMAKEMSVIRTKFLNREKTDFTDRALKDSFLIHGDFHNMNLFFHKNEIVGVFDFEKTEIDSITKELSRVILYTCFFRRFKADDFKKAASLLKGYKKNMKISKTDFRLALNNFIEKEFYSNWILKEKYLIGNDLLDELLPCYFERIRYLDKNKKTFVSKILSMI